MCITNKSNAKRGLLSCNEGDELVPGFGKSIELHQLTIKVDDQERHDIYFENELQMRQFLEKVFGKEKAETFYDPNSFSPLRPMWEMFSGTPVFFTVANTYENLNCVEDVWLDVEAATSDPAVVKDLNSKATDVLTKSLDKIYLLRADLVSAIEKHQVFSGDPALFGPVDYLDRMIDGIKIMLLAAGMETRASA